MIAEVLEPPVLGGLRAVVVPADEWEELDACPLCGSADDLVDVAVVEGRGTITSVCLACEYGFLRRRPSAAWVESYYRSGWDARSREKEAEARPRPHVLEFCAPWLAPHARVLDAGAGFGSRVLAFREAGYDVEAFEPSEHRAAYVREQLGIQCRTTTIEAASVERPFDLVFLRHVLEHVRDPRAAIAAARRQLATGGLLFVAVPNIWSEAPPQSFHYVPHLSLFSEGALRRLAAREGFEVVRLEAETELRLLARRTEDAQPDRPADDSARRRFRKQVEDWAGAVFGGSGERTAVWFKTRRRLYRGYVVRRLPGSGRGRVVVAALRHAREGDGLRNRLALWFLRRWLPPRALLGSVRMLRVRVSDTGLPITIRWHDAEPPVWLK